MSITHNAKPPRGIVSKKNNDMMATHIIKTSILFVLFLFAPRVMAEDYTVSIQYLKGFPKDEQGMAQGVSACYAGSIGHTLVMAGGCNFPDVPAADGGAKRYYQGIYAAPPSSNDQLSWKRIGTLPVPAAYGASVSAGDGIICIGGMNGEGSLRDVFRISLAEGRAIIDSLPSLPVRLDNLTAAMQSHRIMVRGGRLLLTLDLLRPEAGWQTVGDSMEMLQQPVSAFLDGRFCVWGGYTPKTPAAKATLNMGGQSYGQTVEFVAAPVDEQGETVFLGGAAAVNISGNKVVAVGGVNKEVFLRALNDSPSGYLRHPKEWYRFNPCIFIRDHDGWKLIGRSQATARAGASLVACRNDIYVIGGELKPGIRTPEIVRLTIHANN